jgi:diadenosine tetraphosphate (Ap4A) HIT family hydrolase
MAQHTLPCPICAQIELCQAGTQPRLIAEMRSGWAVLGESQLFRGYSLLLCKTPATELHELSTQARRQFLDDMSALARAVNEEVRPRKLNYEMLGNLAPHLHWHLLPRHEDDAQPSQPVWNFWNQSDPKYFYDPARDAELIAAIRQQLATAMTSSKS